MNQYFMNEMLSVAYAEEAATDTTTTTTTGTVDSTDTANQAVNTTSSTISTIVIMVIMVAVFYFLLIRPQRKKDKAVKNGTISAIKDDNVTITLGAQQNTVVIARWAIRSVEDAPAENDQELSN